MDNEIDFKVISLVTDDYDKSVVFYGSLSSDQFLARLHFHLMKNLDVDFKDHKKKFKVNGPALDFNSSYRDSFEDELVKKVEECIKEFKECVKA